MDVGRIDTSVAESRCGSLPPLIAVAGGPPLLPSRDRRANKQGPSKQARAKNTSKGQAPATHPSGLDNKRSIKAPCQRFAKIQYGALNQLLLRGLALRSNLSYPFITRRSRQQKWTRTPSRGSRHLQLQFKPILHYSVSFTKCGIQDCQQFTCPVRSTAHSRAWHSSLQFNLLQF